MVIDKEVVDMPPAATPRSEAAETDSKEPNGELGKDATAPATETAQTEAPPRCPTRQRKAPQRLGFDSYLSE